MKYETFLWSLIAASWICNLLMIRKINILDDNFYTLANQVLKISQFITGDDKND